MSEKNSLIVQTKDNVANILRTLAAGIEQGTVSHYELYQSSDGTTTIKADSSDGKTRIIQSQRQLDGYTHTSTEHIEKQKPESRRRIVKALIEKGHTQNEIAEKTIVSQKTISDDIKKLKKDGLL